MNKKQREGYIRLAKEMAELSAEIRKERAELDLPSDMNDPDQMMIYEEIDELLTALDAIASKAILGKQLEGESGE